MSSSIKSPLLTPDQESKKLLKAKKRTAPALALNSFPGETKLLLGKHFIFSGSIVLLTSMSFVSGYLDAYTFDSYGIFVTMSTGNIIVGVISLSKGIYSIFLLCLFMSIATTIGGGLFASYVAEVTFPSRKHAFFLLTSVSMLGMILNEISMILNFPYHEYCSILLAISNGALLYWNMKAGYQHAIFTNQILRCTESVHKYLFNVGQGGAKLRGDLLIIVAMLFSFLCGTFALQLVRFYTVTYCLFPLFAIHVLQNLYAFGFLGVAPIPPVAQTPPPQPIRTSVTQKLRESLIAKPVVAPAAVAVDTEKSDIVMRDRMLSIANNLTQEEEEQLIVEEENEDDFEDPDYLNPMKVSMIEFTPGELDQIRDEFIQERASVRLSKMETRRLSMAQFPRQSNIGRSSIAFPIRASTSTASPKPPDSRG